MKKNPLPQKEVNYIIDDIRINDLGHLEGSGLMFDILETNPEIYSKYSSLPKKELKLLVENSPAFKYLISDMSKLITEELYLSFKEFLACAEDLVKQEKQEKESEKAKKTLKALVPLKYKKLMEKAYNIEI